MRRRDFCELMATGAGLGASVFAAFELGLLAGTPLEAFCQEASTPWPAMANYPNNRSPLFQTKYVKLPLGDRQAVGLASGSIEGAGKRIDESPERSVGSD